ncbi:phospho-sugar mutase [Euzebya tangerina]|uniref:phospho-sugar mutase n=1 Tax=Euzebya tangerina TaxID=591198 RepID=UPI000E31ECB8|nr:phospho-sugar mutase [Euzebya tangerina]
MSIDRAQVLAWMDEDPDPETREELQALLDIDDEAGLEDRFGERLEFGTAGIRGALGAGPNRMNRALVRRVTAGLADRLNQAAGAAGARGVVVGRDARHKSDAFAADAAVVLAGAGLGVWKFSDIVPTPLVAYAVRTLEAAAGVMVTASHNPPADNGYKVFGPGGRQIVSPLDEEISAAIDAVESLNDVPLAQPDDDLIWTVPADVPEQYLSQVVALVGGPAERRITIVYSAMHGVAGAMCLRALDEAGFIDVHAVAEQFEPDPDFPTVSFPNPEEPGAMDASIALAQEVEADLIVANDPDGDRIAVGFRTAGGYRMLTGDEIGVLLAEDILARGAMTQGRTPAVATTVVSSSLLSKVAAHHDAEYAETLTGFKWLAVAAIDAEDRDAIMVLSYEQALGVCVGDLVRDKDGISGIVAMADLADRLAADGRTLGDLLDDLTIRHGAHVTQGRSVMLEGDDGEVLVQAALDRLRSNPPTSLGESPVIQVWDHDAGVVTSADGTVEPIDLPPTPLLRYVAEDGTRVMVRPSGTEPKLKFYGEAVHHTKSNDPTAARHAAAGKVGAVLDAFMARAQGGAKV